MKNGLFHTASVLSWLVFSCYIVSGDEMQIIGVLLVVGRLHCKYVGMRLSQIKLLNVCHFSVVRCTICMVSNVFIVTSVFL